ncbi:hypothetical protein SPRG_10288 [Saprolegnia parasitica CBS 223.65]|uniref:RGS domain-containing protein n=1 Tax=Saprolegnia parasitica (strain CBS 223.65) TaxID=695850 RepID=A0A067CCC2_SAPPC|nr:hypothetical protein SPRG_10288 [Saprolegnia parasitica CBS 223.65]KDO24472.1 hypothetical protein SPRG_10288 [Saprolegnia parasitica CBS 223.65]|eukprot:XP_012204738.1 hypothetical protein SPRG_10288 [Saprolegnia parasitica CBS 223.65]
MNGVPPELVPLLAVWASCLYMPFAVALYVYFKRHPSLRHRMPTGTAIAGACATVFCLTQPLCVLYGAEMDCGLALVVLQVSCATSSFALVWTAFTVLVLYGITEIIASPTSVPLERAALWTSFRGMIIPTVQIPVGICASITWNLPQIILLTLHSDEIGSLTYAECVQLPLHTTQSVVQIVQALVLVLTFLYVAYQLRSTLDTFRLRRCFTRTSLYMLLLGVFAVIDVLIETVVSLAAYHITELLWTLALQGVVIFNILLPLIGAFRGRHQVQRIRGSVSPQVNLDTYLQIAECFDNFLDYCNEAQDSTGIAMLQAWQACVAFHHAASPYNVVEFYQLFVASGGAGSIHAVLDDEMRRMYAKRVQHLKKKTLLTPRAIKVVPLASSGDIHFYQPLRHELINKLVTCQLRGYEKHELGKDWLAFHTRRRSIHSLEYVQRVATRSILDTDTGNSKSPSKQLQPTPSMLLSSLAASSNPLPNLETQSVQHDDYCILFWILTAKCLEFPAKTTPQGHVRHVVSCQARRRSRL